MSALMQNKLSLALGRAQVITEKAVILPRKTCFKICFNGLISAMKLADARAITVLKAHCQDLFLESCTNLSESCSKVIHQFKMFKDHKLISVESISPDVSALADSLKSSSLAVLDISECNPTNEVAKHVGAGLAENKLLKQFNIQALVGSEVVHIFRALEHNSSVQKLKISLGEGIGSSETVVTALSQMLTINKFLIVLDLSGCGVTDAAAQHIASGLAENKTLQALNTNSDQLKSEGAGFILHCLQHNETIHTLRIFDLDIQITHVPLTLSITAGASNKRSLALLVSSLVHTSIEKLQMFTGIGVLDLSQCGITDAMAEKIVAGLTENSSLTQLDLSGNEITSVGAAHIFRSLEHNTSLNKLLLSHNSQLAMGDSEMFGSRLQQMLAANESLTVLDLSGCGVTDAVAQHIARGLTENKTLQALNTNSVQLGSEGVGYILQCLQQNETLRVLRVFNLHIQITGVVLTLNIAARVSKKQSLALLVSLFVHNTSIDKLQMFTGTGVLDLSECGITDVMVEKIAGGLTKNSSLKQLDLSGNEITSVGAAHIFRSLEHNTSLEELLLSCNPQLAMRDSELFGFRLQQMLATNKSLTVLDLSGCGITDVIAQHIARGLTENKTLQALGIDSVDLTHEGIKCITQALKHNEAIKILKRYGINLEILYNPFCFVILIEHDTSAANIFKSLEQDTTVEGLVISRLPPTSNNRDDEPLGCAVEGLLTVNQTLRILKLRDCFLNDVIAGHIATGLTKNSSVKQLNLKSASITSVGATHIFKSLKHNTSLEELNLSFFFAKSDDSGTLGCAVEGMLTINQTLRILDLQDCRHLNDVIADHIAAGLAKNSSVKQLNLKLGRITNIGTVYIFKSLEHNTSLEELELSLSSNNFSYYPSHSDNSEALGCAMEGMLTVNQTLRILNLQNCHLNDVIAGHIAAGLAKNSSVKQLNLKSNRITITGAAHIFRSLEYNSNLEELDLSSNELFSHYLDNDSEALHCAVEEMLTVNQTLRILNLRDCNIDVIACHIATGLKYNSSCTCYTCSSHITPQPRSIPPVAPSSILPPIIMSLLLLVFLVWIVVLCYVDVPMVAVGCCIVNLYLLV